MTNTIIEMTNFLFNCDFFSEDFDPEGMESHLDKAHELQQNFPWNNIIIEWHNYLYNNCHTPEEIINFANLFFYYEGADNYNPEPYKFLGYLYSHVDMDLYWEQAGDLFDSISIDILQNQMLIDLSCSPYYSPLKDDNILNAIKVWKEKQ